MDWLKRLLPGPPDTVPAEYQLLSSTATPSTPSQPAPQRPLRSNRLLAYAVVVTVVAVSLGAVEVLHKSASAPFLRFPGPWRDTAVQQLPRNVQLLQTQFAQPLRRGDAIRIGIVGGSVSQMPDNYGTHLVSWLNRNWPPREGQHEVVNMAIAASESGATSTCLDTFFAPYARPRQPPIDLLLVEFAYNDNALLPGEEGVVGFQVNRRANYERILRTALEWPTPVIVVEIAALERDVPPQRNSFANSCGRDHAEVAEHYAVPIVDWARFLYTYPAIDNVTEIFKDEGLHPNWHGHNLLAGVVLREMLYHMQLGNDTAILAKGDSGPSWPVRHAGNYHGLGRLAPVTIRDDELDKLASLPRPRWQLGSSAPWQCVSSQIKHTVDALNASVVSSDGWFYGTDQSDGGGRRFSRPGYTTTLPSDETGNVSTGAHLVFDVGNERSPVALLYRRSWHASADALVWIDEDPDATIGAEERRSPRCPPQPARLAGTWSTPSTQMVLEEVCSGPTGWSAGQAREGGKSYLHILTVQPLSGDQSATYFKSYGYAVRPDKE
ncbi:hypothetical protein Rhopal_006357-T1 [Rhodotorula paludigena]|uniref:SGNH hydrolase-type esterase domain-containing protein n=1 Tax=Rhodotorula paludigena TaxID=86838 RepID=A0AAV5GTR9_9BASI|nr:hypothetical protein Rhopal_006357-T1 [Rhodotorula paludigena]